ncbi:MAG TPA: MFS transporter [Acetobacteraceae bacterium]|nr:MFS transporter [Acetobacteraceae bacterium]
MHSTIVPRRWWALGSVAAAQFLAVADAFIVNVAMPAIRADLHAGAAEIQAVVAVYQIAYASLVITGGRLGDIVGRKRVFIAGVLGFTLASLWCGVSGSPTMLIFARAAQGGAAAMMVPQVLATMHTLFPDAARARAFTFFAVAIGLGAAVGFMAGGWLVTLNIGGLGWRAIFCVNVPVGAAIALAAAWLMPVAPRDATTRLDLRGASALFVGLIGVVVPLMFGRELGWPWWMWATVVAGVGVLAGFLRLQRATERSGGMPLIDLSLLEDDLFITGMAATFCFFAANLSFYFVLTLYLQNGLGFAANDAALTVLPLAIAFVVGSRSTGRLVQGCFVQATGLAVTALLAGSVAQPTMTMLVLPLAVFGYGQGMVLAPLFSAVLTQVRHAHAGSGAGILTTTQQVANGVGVVLVGTLYFAVQAVAGNRWAFLAALAMLGCCVLATAVFLLRMRLATCPAATVPLRSG